MSHQATQKNWRAHSVPGGFFRIPKTGHLNGGPTQRSEGGWRCRNCTAVSLTIHFTIRLNDQLMITRRAACQILEEVCWSLVVDW